MSNKIEEEITIESSVALKGTLTFPSDNQVTYPVVLMIHGSGPTDRDENVKNMRLNAFKEISDAIVSQGIATLRYDKRGVGESEGNYLEAGMWDLIDDATAAVQFLKNQPNINAEQIYILGHSEGAIIAPTVYKREKIQGLILLAGATESVKTTILRQSDMLFDELESLSGFKGFVARIMKISEKGKKKQAKLYEKIEASSEDTMTAQGQKLNAKWMREHFKHNVLDDLVNVECPVLTITGSKDLQVLPEQAKIIAETVQGESEYHIVEDLTHILRKQKNKASMLNLKKDYKELINKPIDAEVIELIITWLNKQTKKI